MMKILKKNGVIFKIQVKKKIVQNCYIIMKIYMRILKKIVALKDLELIKLLPQDVLILKKIIMVLKMKKNI